MVTADGAAQAASLVAQRGRIGWTITIVSGSADRQWERIDRFQRRTRPLSRVLLIARLALAVVMVAGGAALAAVGSSAGWFLVLLGASLLLFAGVDHLDRHADVHGTVARLMRRLNG